MARHLTELRNGYGCLPPNRAAVPFAPPWPSPRLPAWNLFQEAVDLAHGNVQGFGVDLDHVAIRVHDVDLGKARVRPWSHPHGVGAGRARCSLFPVSLRDQVTQGVPVAANTDREM